MNKGTLIVNGIDYSNGGGASQELIDQVEQNTSDIAYYEERGFLTKNIININNSTLSYNIDDSGNGGTNTLVDTSDFIEAKPNTAYVFSFYRNQANGYIRIHEFNANRQWIKLALKDTTLTTNKQYDEIFTTSADCAYIKICYENKATNVIFSEGSQPISYVPFAKSNVELTNSKADKIDVLNSKNLLNIDNFSAARTIAGITFTPVYDVKGLLQYINVNGTATSEAVLALTYNSLYTNGSKYILSGCIGGSASTYALYWEGHAGQFDAEVTVTETATTKQVVKIVVKNGITVSNVKFYPMIRLATEPTGYVPYNGKYSLEGKKVSNEIVTDVWDSTVTYAVGSYCIYNNSLWKCLTQNKAIIPVEGSNWTKTSLSNEFGLLTPSKYDNSSLTYSGCSYVAGGIVKIGNIVMLNIRVIASSNSFRINGLPEYSTLQSNGVNATAYDVSANIEAGGYVTQNGELTIFNTLNAHVYFVSAFYLI